MTPKNPRTVEQGERIKKIREENGISQEILALETEISLENLKRIEGGDSFGTKNEIEAIAAILGVDIRLILGKPIIDLGDPGWIIAKNTKEILPAFTTTKQIDDDVIFKIKFFDKKTTEIKLYEDFCEYIKNPYIDNLDKTTLISELMKAYADYLISKAK